MHATPKNPVGEGRKERKKKKKGPRRRNQQHEEEEEEEEEEKNASLTCMPGRLELGERKKEKTAGGNYRERREMKFGKKKKTGLTFKRTADKPATVM